MRTDGDDAEADTAPTAAPDASRSWRWRRVSPTRRGLVLAWWGFTVTFGGLRLLTWLIHIDTAGVGNVSAGGVHIHHYVWGILILMAVGAVGLVERSPRWHAWMGLAYGIGAALVIDETANLIDLKDVYWEHSGGVSIALALIIIGLAGSLLAFTRRDKDDREKPR
ncbi:hypothetical protein [Kitasatospora sp. NPDC002040]|uniref:hypothetical protein n=1 Tax=Kitasatospora sp. NPDC002040 TaxID=3154661 RepID=UPI0033348B0B